MAASETPLLANVPQAGIVTRRPAGLRPPFSVNILEREAVGLAMSPDGQIAMGGSDHRSGPLN